MLAVLDTTVLVAGLVESHPQHQVCRTHLHAAARTPGSYRCSLHAIAETFRVLVALPLSQAIDTDAARKALHASILPRLNPIPLGRNDYELAMDVVCASGMGAGAIYDCLHLLAAERVQASFLVTSNTKHFQRLAVAAKCRLHVVEPTAELR